MVAQTTAKDLFLVANSSFVGTWDVPENSNWSVVDAALGQIVNIPLNNSPVTLAAGQYQCYQITFSSTLTGSVAITFPSTFTGPYVIQNLCTGSSAFVVTLQTTVAGGRVVGCPPGEAVDVINDGTNLYFKNLDRVGTYWDYAGSSVPAWVTACTVPPYLNCDGTAFSSATYPALTVILGGTTLPDSKGRTRFALNQGSARITSSAGYGIDGNTAYAGGGSQSLAQANIPSYSLTVTDPGHSHNSPNAGAGFLDYRPGTGSFGVPVAGGNDGGVEQPTASQVTGITVNSAGSGRNFVSPGYIGGITMVRAA